MMYKYCEKSVVMCPWQLYPRPAWNQITNLKGIFKAFLEFIKEPSIYTLMCLALPLLQSQSL